MKLIGILSWYDESPGWLAACIASLARAGASHVVAVDGAFRLYPEGRRASPGAQADAITKTAFGCGIGCTLHQPHELWAGNEVEKRSFCFRLAEQIAEPGEDWYLILDADEVIVKADEVCTRLAASELNVAEVTALEYNDPLANPKTAEASRLLHWQRENAFPVRKLFRALPGLTLCGGNHYTYGVPGALEKLWGNPAAGDVLEPALDLTHQLKLEHRTNLRDAARKASQREYYKIREETGAEHADCARCHRPATRQAPTGFEPHPDGMVAGWTMVCDDCAEDVEAENEHAIRQAGFDPAELSVDLTRPIGA